MSIDISSALRALNPALKVAIEEVKRGRGAVTDNIRNDHFELTFDDVASAWRLKEAHWSARHGHGIMTMYPERWIVDADSKLPIRDELRRVAEVRFAERMEAVRAAGVNWDGSTQPVVRKPKSTPNLGNWEILPKSEVDEEDQDDENAA